LQNDTVVVAPLDVRALRAIRWPAVGEERRELGTTRE
jgi:hypothetical protein